jgi:hypothetical protein
MDVVREWLVNDFNIFLLLIEVVQKGSKNSTSYCFVSAENARSRTLNVRSPRIFGSLPRTTCVLPWTLFGHALIVCFTK